MNPIRPFDLTGRTAIITGGASGIGLAIARLFARQGAAVEIFDLDGGTGQTAAQEIRTAGGEAVFTSCDVSSSCSVQAAYDSLFARRSRLHILVNNAGIAYVGNLLNTTEADFDRLWRVNALGVFHCLQPAVRHMREHGGGVILNISSAGAFFGLADRFAYISTKAAVWAMTLSVAKDFLADHIRCNAIAPGRIHTPFVEGFIAKNYPGREAEMFAKLSNFQPVGRMGTPEEIASAVLYLCSDEASFVTGALFAVDGGTINLR